jgi:hypothetical protein
LAIGVLALAGSGSVRLSVDGHDAALNQLKSRGMVRLFLFFSFSTSSGVIPSFLGASAPREPFLEFL